MIIDLGRWRRIGVADIAERFLAEYSDALFTHDQHVLNLIFRDSWKRIDLRWNYMEEFYRGIQKSRTYSAHDILAARKNPAVIHFAVGTDKPWLRKSGHPQAHRYREQLAALRPFQTGLQVVEPGGS
jgi:lipopolysaccharide biosynthesis glycosyltransferase